MEKEPQLKSKSQEELNKIADKLDELQRAYAKRWKLDQDVIPYVNWIVQDLRKGDFHRAQVNYSNQSDKYDSKPEIKQFLIDAGIAKKTDWKEELKEQEEKELLFEQNKKNFNSIKKEMKQKGFDHMGIELLTKTVFKDGLFQTVPNKTKEIVIEEYKREYPFEFDIELKDIEGLKENQKAVYVFIRPVNKKTPF